MSRTSRILGSLLLVGVTLTGATACETASTALRAAPAFDRGRLDGFPVDLVQDGDEKTVIFGRVLETMRGDRAYELQAWEVSPNVEDTLAVLDRRRLGLEIRPEAGQVVGVEHNGSLPDTWRDLELRAAVRWAVLVAEHGGDKTAALAALRGDR